MKIVIAGIITGLLGVSAVAQNPQPQWGKVYTQGNVATLLARVDATRLSAAGIPIPPQELGQWLEVFVWTADKNTAAFRVEATVTINGKESTVRQIVPAEAPAFVKFVLPDGDLSVKSVTVKELAQTTESMFCF